MSTFRVGQKVVCVDDRVGYTTKRKTLVKEKIYTVSEIKGEYVFLSEIPVIIYKGKFVRPKYNTNRFKPLQDNLSNTTYNEVMEWIESGKPIEILN